jgi:uncharacterized protein YdbL (DUF1318 family)
MKAGRFLLRLFVVLAGAACAVITVNIYFPEKDVQEAYRVLEKELMTPGGEQKEQAAPAKPESRLRLEWVKTAWAEEENLAEKIAETVKRMPDVVEAYRQMGVRLAEIDRLREAGLVGEANTGLLVPRGGSLSAEDSRLVEAENENRKTVIRGMAKAIVRINRQPDTPANVDQVMPQATAQFAAIRRDSARKGWWIQTEDGNWVRK